MYIYIKDFLLTYVFNLGKYGDAFGNSFMLYKKAYGKKVEF